MKFTFLGTGTSVGVPTIGCSCRVCMSDDVYDKRLRASALLETDNTRVLIDCGPDFRQQMLSQPFRKIDAVLLTHIHYDHVGGLDDLRPFCAFGDINVFADEFTAHELKISMPYCFAEHLYPGVPRINLKIIHPHEAFTVGGINIMPIQVLHDKMPILGFRFGNFAYITDMKYINNDEYEYLKGIKTLVVNALRFKPDHHSHLTVSEAINFAKCIDAERVYLTHICHDMGLHREVTQQLPDGISLAYDGQEIFI